MEQENREEIQEEQDNSTEQLNKEEAKKNKKISYMEILLYIVVLVLCVYFFPKYIIQRTIVSGSSMENTLMNNDNLLVEKLSYHFGSPKRFDIVVFYPYGKEVKEYYVKRVIGLPGETIQIVGEDIYINNKKLEENYGKDPIRYSGIASEPLLLEDDEYFLMGDNREVSFDSRYEEIGPVHRDYIAGKAVLRIWPLNAFGSVK